MLFNKLCYCSSIFLLFFHHLVFNQLIVLPYKKSHIKVVFSEILIYTEIDRLKIKRKIHPVVRNYKTAPK